MEKIVIDDDLYLSATNEADKAILVQSLNDEEICSQTLHIPYPYTEKDAESFLKVCRELKKQHGRNINWMIRRSNGEGIGLIVFKMEYGEDSHKDQIGYWMAREYRGYGIMTKVLKRFCEYAFSYVGLIRIEAYTLDPNVASERVLQKAGFKHEGSFRKIYKKKGKYIDAKLYAMVN